MSDLITAAASGSESTLQPPPLAYKKWAIQEQEKVLDLSSCGMCPLVGIEFKQSAGTKVLIRIT